MIDPKPQAPDIPGFPIDVNSHRREFDKSIVVAANKKKKQMMVVQVTINKSFQRILSIAEWY